MLGDRRQPGSRRRGLIHSALMLEEQEEKESDQAPETKPQPIFRMVMGQVEGREGRQDTGQSSL